MLNWIYKRYKTRFWDLIVQDFFGDIPESIKEPSIDFLAKARPTLERLWSIQAYNIQRRSISDPKNAQIYQGILLNIRTLLHVVSKGNYGIANVVVEGEKAKVEDPMKNIEEFIKGNKAKK